MLFDALLMHLRRSGGINSMRLGELKRRVIGELPSLGVDPENAEEHDGIGVDVSGMSNQMFKRLMDGWNRQLYVEHSWRTVLSVPYDDGAYYVSIVRRGKKI